MVSTMSTAPKLPILPQRIKSTNTKSEIITSYRTLETDLKGLEEQQTVLFVVVGLLIVLIVL